MKYTLLNRYTILEIAVIYRFIDSKKKKKTINWISGLSSYMPKTQLNIQPKTHILYHFLCGTQEFSPLQYHVKWTHQESISYLLHNIYLTIINLIIFLYMLNQTGQVQT